MPKSGLLRSITEMRQLLGDRESAPIQEAGRKDVSAGPIRLFDQAESQARTVVKDGHQRFYALYNQSADPIMTREDFQICCDSVEIEQVLVNLINNAIDAVKGQENAWVKLNCFEVGSQVVLQVIDSGLGLSKEVEAKLFQPFFPTKPVGEGTGLGLSIVKGILDEHKASISLNRAMPHTCFEIRFPKA